mgnify:CR=1 FL=1
MNPKKTRRLRALVYTGLAGGLVGVSTYSGAAHGNASSHGLLRGQDATWWADEPRREDPLPPQPVPEPLPR